MLLNFEISSDRKDHDLKTKLILKYVEFGVLRGEGTIFEGTILKFPVAREQFGKIVPS